MTDAPHVLNPSPQALDYDAFVSRYGDVYEHSPWIAAALFESGVGPQHDTAEGLAMAMAAIVDAAPEPTRLALLRAHPDLAGRLATAGGLTASSTQEQAGAGLDRCTPQEFARFTDLNAAYTAKFAFPFIIAVRGLDRAGILSAFESRIANDAPTEFATATAQVHRIARLRLTQL